MRNLAFALIGLVSLAAGSGCCCCENWWGGGCNRGCNSCATPGTFSGAPAGAYLPPVGAPQSAMIVPAGTTAAVGGPYMGSPVATASLVPMESLPTY